MAQNIRPPRNGTYGAKHIVLNEEPTITEQKPQEGEKFPRAGSTSLTPGGRYLVLQAGQYKTKLYVLDERVGGLAPGTVVTAGWANTDRLQRLPDGRLVWNTTDGATTEWWIFGEVASALLADAGCEPVPSELPITDTKTWADSKHEDDRVIVTQ